MTRALRIDLLDELAGTAPFAGLSRRELQQVTAAVDIVEVEPGTEIVRQGDTGHDLYVVLGGAAAAVEDDRPAAMLGPGDSFGETGVFAGARHPASVVATDPLRLAVLGRRAVFGLLHVVPQIAPHLLRGMAARLVRPDARGSSGDDRYRSRPSARG